MQSNSLGWRVELSWETAPPLYSTPLPATLSGCKDDLSSGVPPTLPTLEASPPFFSLGSSSSVTPKESHSVHPHWLC